MLFSSAFFRYSVGSIAARWRFSCTFFRDGAGDHEPQEEEEEEEEEEGYTCKI